MAPEGEVTPREGRLDRVEKDQDKLSLEKKSTSQLNHQQGYIIYLGFIYHTSCTYIIVTQPIHISVVASNLMFARITCNTPKTLWQHSSCMGIICITSCMGELRHTSCISVNKTQIN